MKSLGKSFCQFYTEFHRNMLLFKIIISTCKRQRRQIHSFACTWWLTDMVWLIKWNAKAQGHCYTPPLTESMCWFTSTLFKKLSFFFLQTLLIPSGNVRTVHNSEEDWPNWQWHSPLVSPRMRAWDWLCPWPSCQLSHTYIWSICCAEDKRYWRQKPLKTENIYFTAKYTGL